MAPLLEIFPEIHNSELALTFRVLSAVRVRFATYWFEPLLRLTIDGAPEVPLVMNVLLLLGTPADQFDESVKFPVPAVQDVWAGNEATTNKGTRAKARREVFMTARGLNWPKSHKWRILVLHIMCRIIIMCINCQQDICN